MRTLLLALLSAGCASPGFVPEPIHPSAERIAELWQVRTHAPVKPRELTLTVSPRFAFAGGAAWVTCIVPLNLGAGSIRYGLTGVRTSDARLDRLEYKTLIEHLPCGVWLAVCHVVTASAVLHRDLSLSVTGAGCDGGTQ